MGAIPVAIIIMNGVIIETSNGFVSKKSTLDNPIYTENEKDAKLFQNVAIINYFLEENKIKHYTTISVIEGVRKNDKRVCDKVKQ